MVGTAGYEHLEQLPGVTRNLDRLRTLLTDPELWGLGEDNCAVILDAGREVIAGALDAAAQAAQDLFLVYYAGHGLCAEHDGALFLATPGTSQEHLWTALEFEQVRLAFRRTRAARKVLILDCCFSGRAIGADMGVSGAQVADRALIEGTYVLTSTASTRTALAPQGAEFTAFTGELIAVLGEGIPDAGSVLECQPLYEQIRRRCSSKSYPEPQQRNTSLGGRIPLVRNRAHRAELRSRSVSLEPLDFRIEVFHNEYLPPGGDEVNAIITVTAETPGGVGIGATAVAPERRAVVFLLGCAPSMDSGRLSAAKQAVIAAIEMLADGTRFAVIAGTGAATVVYPPADKALATASRATRGEAKTAVDGLRTGSGVAFGRWLTAAAELLADVDLAHAILLTDSVDDAETDAELKAALDACRGKFSCDCRGLGTDWRVDELREIATKLNGSVDVVAHPTDLTTEFRNMVSSWMGKTTLNPFLRIQTPDGPHVKVLRQVSPTTEDLTTSFATSARDTRDYPLGVWGRESRDYHLTIKIPPRKTRIEVLAAQVSIISTDTPEGSSEAGEEVVAQALIPACWTDDEAHTRVNAQVAHYTGQAELAAAIEAGLRPRTEWKSTGIPASFCSSCGQALSHGDRFCDACGYGTHQH
ncbi:caspase, EACC1-associated type [Actinoallomurus sp. CA-150999]|uniref:caspase, EACC1-associated type n=1 Tax=Actinoallomurus sp. CA-150999 TaxID=3239887 RepID=UPI003D90E90D